MADCAVCADTGTVLAFLDRQGGGAVVHVICPVGCVAARRRMTERGIREFSSSDFQQETRNQAVLKGEHPGEIRTGFWG